MNLANWLERAGRHDSGAAALAVGDVVVETYGGLARRAARIAQGLEQRFGLRPGDRVAIVAKNHPRFVEAMFAVWWGGFVVVPVNPKLHVVEVAWILEHSGTRATFVSADLAPAIGSPALDAPVVAFDDAEYGRLAGCDPRILVPRRSDDVAWLFYTSGTTGRPKGAMLTHRNLVTMALASLTDVDVTARGDRLLHAAPLCHGSGLYSLGAVCRAAINVVPESGAFEPSEVLELLSRHGNVSMFASPTIVKRLVRHERCSGDERFRTLIWGGAPMHVEDTQAALERFGPCLAQIYGQGETPMTITVLSKDVVADRTHPRWLERLASAGIANSAVEVRVADAESGQMVPNGAPGEILVRGDTVMAGYWEDAVATGEALRDGWLHTGDIGTLGDDGFLRLLDRSKDVIISGGSNIYPREVEDALLSCPGVEDACVIGRPDSEWGEVVVAYVAGTASTDEMDRHCLARIARFKRPKHYVLIPEMPKNNTGKILKRVIRELDTVQAQGQ